MNETMSTVGLPKSRFGSSRIGIWFAGTAEGVNVLRAPVLMSIVIIIALWLPDQLWEVYRVLVQQGVAAAAPHQWLLAVVSLFALSLIIWQIARELAYVASERRDLDRLPAAKLILEWLPRALAAAPLVGTGLGLWFSWPPKPLPDAPSVLKEVVDGVMTLRANLIYLTVAAFVAAIVLFLAITFFERRFLQDGPARLAAARGRRLSLINYWFLFPAVGLVSIIAFAWSPISLPQRFGVIPIIAFWAAITTAIAAAGTRFCDATRIPVVTIAIVVAVVLEVLSLSNNHKFRTLQDTDLAKRPDADQAFMQWIKSRKDLDAYKGKHYPVYIVAAEGGGMYAALHAAKILGRLQDMCPNFAQHVFAVSSVSGGSLGAAVFSALAQDGNARNGEYERCAETYTPKSDGFEAKAERILSQDFLSPLVWAGLFPDFVQRFLPVPISRLDRAVALERSFEDAWQRHQSGPNHFAESLFALCGPGSTRCAPQDVAAPALLLNATNVETGAQMVLSPMYLGYTYVSKVGTIEDFYRLSNEVRQLPLSTAVGLSARFPWVLPAGWHEFAVKVGDGVLRRRMSFADGGYYEGSGVATAENLAQYLLWYLKHSPDKPDLGDTVPAITLIMVTGSYQPVERFFEAVQETSPPGEIATPLVTLWQSWRARAASLPIETAADRAEGPYVAKSAEFDNDYLPLPLGWQLGKLSRTYLDLFSGRPQDCRKASQFNLDDTKTREVLLSMNDNDCLIKKVIDDLRADRLPDRK